MNPCKYGHDDGRTKDGRCVTCRRATQRKSQLARFAQDPEAARAKARAAHQKWKLAHPDLERLRGRDWRKNNAVKSLLISAKARAKRAGLPFDLTADDITIPNFCPVLGIPMQDRKGSGMAAPNSPSLDKIIPELGYVRGNVAVISYRANTLKRDATPQELVQIARWLEREDPSWLFN